MPNTKDCLRAYRYYRYALTCHSTPPVILSEAKNPLHTLEKSLNYLQPIPVEAGIQKNTSSFP
jgi:hypothetical protein